MVKCNLNDLDYISEDEARFNGFLGQYDYYLYMLIINNTLEEINETTWLCRKRGQGELMDGITFSRKIALYGYKMFEQVMEDRQDNIKTIMENYDKVKTMYPEYNDFILSLSAKDSSEKPIVFPKQTSRKRFWFGRK